ncbi:putative tyrosyl-dna phosphodiesterase domain protein [Phaeomoniella chlamydospora]|uniref:Putative tyrosyl-dna phosphodiesterase domain protein n=1 Tax=Phaeomoniella chlamydospora TaxID=158046 RepID=A0A0G2ETJ3_PHACM|nr:putative tyrosyl-dna phosphodiesterase domain protein [Phaeomoniella chlamydospora]
MHRNTMTGAHNRNLSIGGSLETASSRGATYNYRQRSFAFEQQQAKTMHGQDVDGTPPYQAQHVIDLTSGSSPPTSQPLLDQEDEDLKKAIKLSLQESVEPASPSREPHNANPVTYGILGIDRKQMEEERLARLKRKRDGPVSPPSTKRPAPSSRPPASLSENVIHISQTTTPKAPNSLNDTQNDSISFPYKEGLVMKTWAFGYPRQRDVKIEEILQRHSLQAAVLSSFQWDMEWLFRKLDTSRTKFVLVMQAKDQATREQYRQETQGMPNLRLCFPPMEGQVSLVPTANLVPYDWGEQGGFMENSAFIIDLPLLEPDTDPANTPFKTQLLHFLKAKTLQQDVLDKLELFDYRETKRYAFIHTIGGSHFEPAIKRTGYCGLAGAVNELGLRIPGPIHLDYITSSVGSLKKEFLRTLYRSALGHDSMAMHQPNRLAGDTKVQIGSDTSADIDWDENFRCYFPSDETVKASKSGPQGAGTVCFQEDWWRRPDFPREIMRDCISTRPGMLMHNKIMYIRPVHKAQSTFEHALSGFAYIGSANLSESAWGKAVYDRKKKCPKLNCRNWECGVLVPFSNQFGGTDSERPAHDLRLFEHIVPVPIQVPARSLASLKPWFFLQR